MKDHNTKIGLLIGVSGIFAAAAFSLVPHFWEPSFKFRVICLFVTLFTLVYAIGLHFWPNLVYRSRKEESEEQWLEIVFDKTNPDQKYWSLEFAKNPDGSVIQPIRQFWTYRVAIGNNSRRTIRNVGVLVDWVEKIGFSGPPLAEAEFARTKTRKMDLQPGCRELIPVHVWPEPVVQPGMAAGLSIAWYGKLKIFASGDDVPPTVRYFKFNYELTPMLFDPSRYYVPNERNKKAS